MALLQSFWFLIVFTVSPVLSIENDQKQDHGMEAVSDVLKTCSLEQYIPKFSEDGYDNINYLRGLPKEEFGQEMSEMQMKKGEWRRLYKKLHDKKNNAAEKKDNMQSETEQTFKISKNENYDDNRFSTISTYKVDSQNGPIQAMAAVSITIPHRSDVPRSRLKKSTTRNIIVISDNQQQLFAIDAIDNSILSSFSSGHTQPITQIKLSRRIDTYMMTGSSDGVCNGYLVASWFQRKLFPEDELSIHTLVPKTIPRMKLSPTIEAKRLSTSTVAKLKFNHEFTTAPYIHDGEVVGVTAVDVYQSGRMLYFMAGYDDGHIRVFSRDGELKTEIASGNTTVNAIHINLPRKRLYFISETGIGQMRILATRRERLSLLSFCLLDNVVEVAMHSSHANYLYVGTMNGTVIVIKADTLRNTNSTSPCKIRFKFSTESLSPIRLVTKNGYLYITTALSLYVYNITDVWKKPSFVKQIKLESIEEGPPPPVTAMTSDERETFIIVAKPTDGEVICYQSFFHFLFSKPGNFFGGLLSSIGFPTRFPIVIIPVAGVLLYKFVLKKDKSFKPEEDDLFGRGNDRGRNRRGKRRDTSYLNDSFEAWKAQKEKAQQKESARSQKDQFQGTNSLESVEAMQSRVDSLYKSMESAQEQLKTTTEAFSKLATNQDNKMGISGERGNLRTQKKQDAEDSSYDELD